MEFQALQDHLRLLLRDRIADGELTGFALARETGFRQAHICNFLNHKRGLSISGLDRVLAAQHLSVTDLLDDDGCARSRNQAPAEADYVSVVLVSAENAATLPRFTRAHIQQQVMFRKSFLSRLHTASPRNRRAWKRFVLITVNAQDGFAMSPRLSPGTLMLIDRHYTSPVPHKSSGRSMYLLEENGYYMVRYVEQHGSELIFRPENPSYPVIVKVVRPKSLIRDYIVGRVCHLSSET